MDVPFWVSSGAYWIDGVRDDVVARYLYHAMKCRERFLMGLASDGPIRDLYPDVIARLQIPVPASSSGTGACSVSLQTDISVILDKFHAYCYDMQSGLKGEIELRRQQYEYYRDLLLSFPEKREA